MKQYEELTFTDDYMFCKILQQDEDLCKRFVEVIIGKKIGEIIHNEKQKPIEITSDGKGVRLDVYLEDDKDSVYNIEMQNADTKNIAKRARYYQGMLDVEYMERGWEYEKLKKSYIIFINQFDMFGEGLARYTFTYLCHEKAELEMGDETTKIFLNTQGICDTIEPELNALLSYLCDGKATTDLTKDIETRIVKARSNPRWKGDFMTLYEHYQIEREKGIKQGIKQGVEQGKCQGIIDAIDSIMNQGHNLDEACKLVGITEEKYHEIRMTIDNN